MPRKCGTPGGMWTSALSSSTPPSLVHTPVHTQIPPGLPSTSLTQVFQGACDAHKDLFITGLNTRCHIRGSGARTSLAEREKREDFM